jgi:hypothetical protein
MMMMVLLVLMIGNASTSSSNSSSGSNIILLLEHYLVPTYTTGVLLYLAFVALRPHLVDDYCWRRLFSLPVSVDNDDDDDEMRKRKQLRSLSTTVTTPLEEEEEEGVSAAQEANDVAQQQQQQRQPIDMSGAFKLVSNDNFEGFLAVQGLPWALRRAANQARPVHRITHVGCHLTIKIEGIIESQTSYIINGPPVETNVRGRIFRDAVSYLTRAAAAAAVQENNINFDNGATPTASAEAPAAAAVLEKENTNSMNSTNSSSSNNNNCHDENGNSNTNINNSNDDIVGIAVHKEALAPENYTIMVQRQLSSNRQEIVMTSTAFFRDGREPVRCIQQFQRVVEWKWMKEEEKQASQQKMNRNLFRLDSFFFL